MSDKKPAKQIEARVASKAARWDRAERAFVETLKGCIKCDYDEAEGGLLCHCAAC